MPNMFFEKLSAPFRSYQARYIFKAWVFFWGLLTFFRVLFFIFYRSGDVTFSSMLFSFLHGIRFDFSTMALLWSLPLLLFWLPLRLRYYHLLLHFFLLSLLFFAAGVFIADMAYFPYIGRHITIELALFFGNAKDFLAMTFAQYGFVFLLTAFALYVIFYLYRRFVFLPAQKYRDNFISWSWFFVIALLHISFSVLFIRGGVQSRALNPAMAFQSDNRFLGNLTLNGIYTGLTAWFKSDIIPVHQNYHGQEADALHNLLYNAKQTQVHFSHDVFPFFQTRDGQARYAGKKQNPYNLVIVVLESWSAADLTLFSPHKPSATPFFNSLAQKGLLFTNAYATGQRSIASLPSILSSIPSLYGRIYTNSSYSSNRQVGLGTLFKEKGYRTFFAYAASATSMGFASYARIAGFDTVISKESFGDEAEEDGSWGVYDEYTFQKIHALANQEETPFVAVIYTLHPHAPFHLPADFKKPFAAETERADFFNALAYSDKTLQNFFSLAENSWYKDNTIFVFVADHAFEQERGIDQFHIPLLFYSPSLISARRDERVASQLDILPSLVDLFGWQAQYSGGGRSLFDPSANSFAIWDMDNLMAYVKGEQVIFLNNENPMGLYNYRLDPDLQKNLLHNFSADGESLAKEFYLYQSALQYAITKNRLVP